MSNLNPEACADFFFLYESVKFIWNGSNWVGSNGLNYDIEGKALKGFA